MLNGERKTQKQIIAHLKKTKGLELKTSTVSTWYNDAFRHQDNQYANTCDYDHCLYTKYHTHLPKIR